MVLGLCFQIFFFFGRFEKLFSKIVFKCFFSTPKICYTRSFFSSQKQTNKQNKIDYTNLAKPLTVPKLLIEFKKKKKKKPTINKKNQPKITNLQEKNNNNLVAAQIQWFFGGFGRPRQSKSKSSTT